LTTENFFALPNYEQMCGKKAVEIAEEMFDIDITKKFGAQALQQLKNNEKKAKIEELCSFFKKSKQAYYKQLKMVEVNALKEEVILGAGATKKTNLETW
jgi:hypothetical protein